MLICNVLALIFILVLFIIFKDLTSVQNLQKKHTLLEADVASHQDRIEGVKITADQFVDGGHFDADNIRAKQVCIIIFILCFLN